MSGFCHTFLKKCFFKKALNIYMSIVALKRNSRRFQVPVSANGFSLNGGHRNIGQVGVTNLAKSVTRTPFRGNIPMGHGGHNGQYMVSIFNSGSCSANDPNIVKLSTKNTKGHIFESFKYPICDNGNCGKGSQQNWVQDFSAENFSQGVYINNVIAANGSCVVNKDETLLAEMPPKCQQPCKAGTYHIGGKKYYQEYYAKTNGSGAIQSSEYMRSLLQKRNCLPTPPNIQHFPPNVNHDGCDVNALTPQEAIEVGLLPADWTTFF
jgi:hypothetical protein